MKSFYAALFLTVAFATTPSLAELAYFSKCPIDQPNDVVAFCTGENNLGITFPAKTSSNNIEGLFEGGVGCLASTPSPSWFIMQIEDEGDLLITMSHSDQRDIDFACWGPFSGKNKTEVLNKVCGDPNTYFKSPSVTGEPYINLCRLAFERYVDSTAFVCFFEKTGLAPRDVMVAPEAGENFDLEWIDPIYGQIYDECSDYAFATVPMDLENRYSLSKGQGPDSPEVADCFILQDEDELTMVSCSYSTSDIEDCEIRNAKRGDWYILLITNYSQMPGDIFFKKMGGTASTNCKIIVDATSTGPYCEGDDIRFIVNNAPKNATFHWWGPNGFVSDESSPVIKNASSKHAGTYYVKMHSGDVTSDEVEIPVVVAIPTSVDTSVVIRPGQSFLLGDEKISAEGAYTKTLLSEAGCDSTVNLTLIASTSKVFVSPVSPICEGGSFVLRAQLANQGEAYTSKWTGPANFLSEKNEIIVENATPEMAGTYTFTYSAAGEKIEKEVEVVVHPNAKVEKSVTLVDGATVDFGGETISTEGIYTHTFKSEAGCDSVVTLNVTRSDITLGNTGPYCEGETIQLTAEGRIEDRVIEWRGPDGFKSERANPTIENAGKQHGGAYSLYLKEGASEALVGSTEVVVMESVMEKVFLQLDMGDSIQFGELIIDKMGDYTQTYTTAEGCDSIVTISVRIRPDEKSTIRPNGFFTPNADGENDLWRIENVELYANAIVNIYDRYGKLIRKFDTYTNSEGWDGTDCMGVDMPSTDYWFTIDISEMDKIYVGHVTLLR